jgi:signal transduction histidine kinase
MRRPSARESEIAAAILLALLSLAGLFSQHLDRSLAITRKADLLGVVLTLGATLPLAAAHARPRTVTVVCFSSVLVATALGYPTGPAALSPLIALGIAAFLVDRRSAIALGVGAAAGIIAVYFVVEARGANQNAAFLVYNIAVVALVMALGIGLQIQREYARALESRTRELEDLRDVERREAIAQERLRIARELHDIVGHALAAITLHAQVARRRLTGDPSRLSEPLDEIVELSSSALSQTRESVGLMRGDGDPTEVGPLPTLDDLDVLIARLRTANARIELVRDGAITPVPGRVESAGYRIAQEALSNFIKHAGAAKAVVTIRQAARELTVEVRDDGARVAALARPGSGIRGMRERAAALGGTLEAGPSPDGGWTVTARFPIGQASL